MKYLPLLIPAVFSVGNVAASLITGVPGPDDQGGMIMPMVTIQASSGTGADPTAGSINITFNPPYAPTLKPLDVWSPGNWFDEFAAWRADLGPADGSVPGMPSANAGSGDLFNNQYGFMFMSMGTMMMANIPAGNSIGIRLDSISSPDLQSFNYGLSANRWDPVFGSIDSQVLWSGSMWHNYFTLPADAAPGTYTAVFEIFVSSTPFTGSTGFAQYDAAAMAAGKNPNFTSAFLTYNFEVVPEPSAIVLCGVAGLVFLARKRGLFPR